MNIVQCKVCPVCNGTEVRDYAHLTPAARKEHTCENCRGEGIVPLVTCRGCGRPAMEWDAKVPYCGRKECWAKLVEMVDPNERPRVRTGFVPFGPGFQSRYRAPLGRTGEGFVRNSQGLYWNPIKRDFQIEPVRADLLEQLTDEEQDRFAMMCGGYC